jgi:hypothetical protein
MTLDKIRLNAYGFSPLPLRGGWHLSWFGGVDFVQRKIRSFSHQELNTPEFTDRDHILDALQNGKDLFKRPWYVMERIEIENNEYLPLHFRLLAHSY